MISSCSLFGEEETKDKEKLSAPHPDYVGNGINIILQAPTCRSNLDNVSKDKWGWYRSQDLMEADPSCTDGRPALCLHVGTKEEGWYKSEHGERIELRKCATTNNFGIYFVNTDAAEGECAKVPARNVEMLKETPGENVFEKAMNMLLAGPPEGSKRLTTKIPSATKLLEATFESGVVTVNFSASLNNQTDECTLSQRRAQIEKTIKYIPIVTNQIIKDIVIQVEGESVDW